MRRATTGPWWRRHELGALALPGLVAVAAACSGSSAGNAGDASALVEQLDATVLHHGLTAAEAAAIVPAVNAVPAGDALGRAGAPRTSSSHRRATRSRADRPEPSMALANQSSWRPLGRRQVLRRLGGLTALGLFPRLASAFGREAQAAGSYQALVCVFLFGGNDGNNMLVPTEDADHLAETLSGPSTRRVTRDRRR